MTFEEILNRFELVKKNNDNSYQAKCPAHADKKPSLTISKGNKGFLLKCHAGCHYKEIARAVGLNPKELFYDNEENNTLYDRVSNFFCKSKHLEGYTLDNIYIYKDLDGSIAYYKGKFVHDTKGKQFRNFYIDDDFIVTKVPENKGRLIYNINRLVNKDYKVICVTEGEKDCDTLAYRGYISISYKQGDIDHYKDYFKGKYIVILMDNDTPGEKQAREVEKKFRRYCFATKIVKTSDKPNGDVTDYFDEGYSNEDFSNLITSTPWTYANYVNVSNNGTIKINQGIFAEHIKKNEDIIMVGNKTSNKPSTYIYDKGKYINIGKQSLSTVIKEYLPKTYVTANLMKNISELLILGDMLPPSKLNEKEHIINFENGLYDTSTGEFMEHTPKEVFITQIKGNYTTSPVNNGYWDEYFNNFSGGDEEVKNALLEWIGLSISNYKGYYSKIALMLYGLSNSGKTKFMECIVRLIGEENALGVSIGKINDRFTLGELLGKRLTYDGDITKGLLDDYILAIIKKLTGGDKISTERKGQDPIDFIYSGLMMFGANRLPKLKGGMGTDVFNRLLIIPCNNVVPREKQDPRIIDKLMLDREYIISEALKALDRFVKNNFKFTTPKVAEEIKNEYMIESDSVREFIDVRYEITEDTKDKIKTKVIHAEYKVFCEDEERCYIPCNPKEFKKRMELIYNVKVTPYAGAYYYRKIRRKLYQIKEKTPFHNMEPLQEKIQ